MRNERAGVFGVCWYRNEMGYTSTLIEHVVKTGKHVE
jgi:hypothetical protein